MIRQQPPADPPEGPPQGLDLAGIWIGTGGAQGAQDLRHGEPRLAFVDLRVMAGEIAQRLAEAMPLRLQQQDRMRAAMAPDGVRQTQLEGHVEARRSPDAAQVVDGNAAGFEQPEDPAETALPRLGDLEDAMRRAAETDDRRDQGDKKRFVGLVERDVEEDAALR